MQVLTEELVKMPSRDDSYSEPVSRPIPAERKYFSPSTGKLIKTIRRPTGNPPPTTVRNGEISNYLTSNKVFKSAEAYNKLLTVRNLTKENVSGMHQNQKTASPARLTSQRKKHNSTPDKPSLLVTGEKSECSKEDTTPKHSDTPSVLDTARSLDTYRSIDTVAPTQHITAVEVQRKVSVDEDHIGSNTPIHPPTPVNPSSPVTATGIDNSEHKQPVVTQQVVYVGDRNEITASPRI